MNRAWDRREDESKAAFDALNLYLAEDKRSLAKAAKRRAEMQGKSRVDVGQLERWSSRFEWVERASAYDKYIHDQAQAKVERDAVKRREELLRREGEMADNLYDRFNEMLKWPLANKQIVNEEQDAEGRVTQQYINFVPVRWNANSMRLIAETASTLGRKAADMTETKQRVEVTGADGEPLSFADAKEAIDKMTSAELADLYRARIRGDGDS